MNSLYIEVDRHAHTVTYGPIAYRFTEKASADDIQDLRGMCVDRVAMFESLNDEDQFMLGNEVAAVADWREWLSQRKDG